MTDPTIPELVARLREIDSEWGDNWTLGIDEAGNLLVLDGEGEFVGALHEDSDRLAEAVCELRKALPVILDALERGTATRAEGPPSATWRGELEKGAVYLGWCSDGAPRLVTYHLGKWYRYTDGRDAHDLTHVHRMGPIRGPGER